MNFIIGKKLGMTHIFDDKGNQIPVTLIEAGPCQVTQIRTEDKDKYSAIQIGFEKLEEKKVKKPQKSKPFRYVKEFRGDIDASKFEIGKVIDASVFKEGEKVKIAGVTKGKGFAGAMKKWGFKGLFETHGAKHEQRSHGSVGISGLERVLKGRKMAGRMGADRKTIRNLKIVKIDKENNLIAVKGAVPGIKGGLVEIRS